MSETSRMPEFQDRLLHITDLHFWEVVRNPFQLFNKRFIGNANVWLRRRHEYRVERAGEYAEALAATGISTVFAGGDFSSTATEKEFAAAAGFLHDLQRRGLTILALPGNHDMYTFESVRHRRFEKYFAPFLPPDGFPYRHILPGGTPLVLAPTAGPNVLSSRGRIGAAAIEKTAALVMSCPPGPVLVGAHYPLLNHTREYRNGFSRTLRGAERLRATLRETGRHILYIAGHVHRASYTQDANGSSLFHLTTAALFRYHPKTGPSGYFTEIAVRKDGFSVFRHEYFDQWTRRETPYERS